MRYDERGCCDYEVAEWVGDAVLRFLAVAHVMHEDDKSDERFLNPAAEQLLTNRALHARGKQIGLPALALCRPFEANATLPSLRKAACSLKEQANLVEAMLGVLAFAGIEGNGPFAPEVRCRPLYRALDAAHHFFVAAVLPMPPAEPVPLTEQLSQLNRRTARAPGVEVSPTLEERSDALVAAFATVPLLERLDLLLNVCCWNEKAAFQRLEFEGDAFLQYVVSIELARCYPRKNEGELTQMRRRARRAAYLKPPVVVGLRVVMSIAARCALLAQSDSSTDPR